MNDQQWGLLMAHIKGIEKSVDEIKDSVEGVSKVTCKNEAQIAVLRSRSKIIYSGLGCVLVIALGAFIRNLWG